MTNRPALFAGASLATAGAVMLAGFGDESIGDALAHALRYWPVVVIALGAALLARRSRLAVAGTLVAAILAGGLVGGAVVAAPDIGFVCRDAESAAAPTRRGTFSGPTSVDVRIACGELDVTVGDGSDWTLDSLVIPGRGVNVVDRPGRLVVHSSDRDRFVGPSVHADAWRLVLPADEALELSVEVNAGTVRLDLTDASVSRLDVEVHLGEAAVRLPSGDFSGSLEVAAGSLSICVPDDLGVRITGDVALGDATYNGLVRAGGAWESPDYSTARHQAELSVSAGAGSVVVNPAGGCK